MLLGEHGGRDKQGDLFPPHYALECRSECHFGLAETDVATDQAIHRQPGFHLGFRFRDRLELVGCFAIGEGRFEFLLPGYVFGKREPGMERPLGLNLEQLSGVIEGGAFRRLSSLLPFSATDPSELRTHLGQTDIT